MHGRLDCTFIRTPSMDDTALKRRPVTFPADVTNAVSVDETDEVYVQPPREKSSKIMMDLFKFAGS